MQDVAEPLKGARFREEVQDVNPAELLTAGLTATPS